MNSPPVRLATSESQSNVEIGEFEWALQGMYFNSKFKPFQFSTCHWLDFFITLTEVLLGFAIGGVGLT